MQKLFITCCCFLCLSAFAGKIEKGFEAMQEFDYFKAKKTFEKTFKKQIAASAYGLTQIYFRTDNPFHALDSALKYIQLAESNYGVLSQKQKDKYKTIGFDYIAIIDLRAQVSQQLYIRAKKLATIDAYTAFIQTNPWANELFVATYSRDSLLFEQAKKLNTSAGFKAVLDSFPTSSFFNEVKDQYHLLQYKEFTVSNSLSSYLEFLTKFTDNPYRAEAENRVYELVTEPNSIEALNLFLTTYPSNRNIGLAWKRLYQLFMIDFSDDRVEQFMKTYPGYPYKDEIQQDLAIIQLKLVPFKHDNLYGFCDYSGKSIIAPQYEQLGFYKEGLAYAVRDGKYGFIDKANKVVIPFQFESATDFEQGRALVEVNGKQGLIDRTGNYVFPPVFEDIGQFSEDLIYASKDTVYGYYDKNYVMRIPPKFDEAFLFKGGRAKIQQKGKQGYIDIYGTYTTPPAYETIDQFTDSLLLVSEDDQFGIITFSGEVIVPVSYDYIGKLTFNRALVEKDGKIGYIDAKGKLIIPLVYETFPNHIVRGQFKSNFAIVRQKGKYGVLDNTGKLVVALALSDLGEVSSLIAFSKGSLWGYMDPMGKEIFKPTFDFAESFKDSVAIVEKLTLSGVIDVKGQQLIPCAYTEIKRLTDNLFVVSNGAHYGVYNRKGQELIPLNYQQIRVLDKDFLILIGNSEIHYFYLPENKLIVPKV